MFGDILSAKLMFSYPILQGDGGAFAFVRF
jgi:hypothetical protein